MTYWLPTHTLRRKGDMCLRVALGERSTALSSATAALTEASSGR